MTSPQLTAPDFDATEVALLDDAAFEAWLSAIAASDGDDLIMLFEYLESLKEALPTDRFHAICDSWDICPEHMTDLDTCADDGLGCGDDY